MPGVSIYRRFLAFLKTWKCFIPRRDSAKQSPMGSIWYSFHFIAFREGCLMFQNPLRYVAFLKSWFCFIPRRDSAKQSPMGSILILSILLWYEKGIWPFQFTGGNSPKKPWKCLSPKWTLQSRAQWGPFDIISILLCLEKGVWCFKIRIGRWPFWYAENVLTPEGTLRKQNPYGVDLIFFPFYCV